jgi:hypothetical protein
LDVSRRTVKPPHQRSNPDQMPRKRRDLSSHRQPEGVASFHLHQHLRLSCASLAEQSDDFRYCPTWTAATSAAAPKFNLYRMDEPTALELLRLLLAVLVPTPPKHGIDWIRPTSIGAHEESLPLNSLK